MGKSAKLHKRVPKKVKSSASSSANQSAASASSSRNQLQVAKKRSNLKDKSRGSSASEKGVLGGADYLAILHGSRKRAMEEAKKLPRDD